MYQYEYEGGVALCISKYEYEGGVAGRLAPVHGSGDRRRRKARPQQSGPGGPRARCAIQLLPDTSSLIVRSNDLPEAETLIREGWGEGQFDNSRGQGDLVCLATSKCCLIQDLFNCFI